MNITLPDAALTMKTIYPFERKNTGGNAKKWYEKIALGYNSKLKVQTTTTDSLLFTRETIDNAKSGVKHDLTLSQSSRVFKYFSLSPSVNYSETWVLNTIDNNIVQSQPYREIGPTLQDTIDWAVDSLYQTRDSVVTDILSNGGAYRNFGAGITLSTQIYGTKTFKRSPIRGIRHLVKPSITYGYAPDQKDQIDTLYYGENQSLSYSPFDQGPFGSPSFGNLRSQISYRIGNVLEMKYFSKKDSTEKKFKIFDNVTMAGNYNFALDSFKFSKNTIRSTTRILGGMTQIATSWTLDPYILEDGVRVDKTVWSDRKKIARLEKGEVSMNTRLSFSKLRKLWDKKKSEREDDAEEEESLEDMDSGSYADASLTRNNSVANLRDHNHGPGEHDEDEDIMAKKRSLFDLLDKLSFRHDMRYVVTGDANNRKGQLTTNSLNVTGSFELTDNWGVNIGNVGYDFVKKGPTYSTVSFIRKLHCWDMRITWTPGRGNLYTFFIGVSSGTLNFLKYNYGQNNTDSFFGSSRGF